MEIDRYLKQGRSLSSEQEALDFLDAYALMTKPILKQGPKLDRMRLLLRICGNPHHAYPVVHVAGTSGKGSTAVILSHLLAASGFRVGLELSPHFLDIRERMQMQNRLLALERFLSLLNSFLPFLREMETSYIGLPTYFELLTAMGYQSFFEDKTDYAVIETGLGGRFDATNLVEREDKIAVLTKIGFDHMDLLGDALEKIAWEKVGIIQHRNLVFSCKQDDRVKKVIEHQTMEQEAGLNWIRPDGSFKVESIDEQGTVFRMRTDDREWEHLRVGLIGRHQAENAALALSVIHALAQRDGWIVNEQKIRMALAGVQFAGRMQIVRTKQKRIILDVAHNPQKMEALIATLKELWPGMRFGFALAFGPSAQHEAMLCSIAPVAREIVFADFVVGTKAYRHKFTDVDFLKRMAKEKFSLEADTVQSPGAAAAWVQSTSNDIIVITGAFHFVAAMRPHVPDKIDGIC